MPASASAQLDGFSLNAVADPLDLRDRYYQPALVQLAAEVPVPPNLTILDQGREGACTGFGLAAVINLLNQRRDRDIRVSPRMLYEMAKRHDDWAGEDYSGSSCRGAIKGWYNMGVCSEAEWPYRADGALTIDRAKDALNNTIGAYYRLRLDVTDFHAALNEVGAIYVSAKVHAGWKQRAVRNGKIPFERRTTGGHAFAIVGYNDAGFYVQNSWNDSWGDGGVALWSYEDWKKNIYDAWVFQLARPLPQIFPGRKATAEQTAAEGVLTRSPGRNDIMGHFVHLDDGDFHTKGKYWSDLHDVKQTAQLVANSSRYQHLLFYAHGGLNSVNASASRILAMKEVFKANGVYPFHFMYDTGILEEIKDVLRGKKDAASDRMQGFTDWTDRFLEFASRSAGRALWRQMKFGARAPFQRGRDGVKTLKAFVGALGSSNPKIKIHVVGHSTGAILHTHLLAALRRAAPQWKVDSCSFLAPAASIDLIDDQLKPLLTQKFLSHLSVYNLTDKLERNDTVAIYRKSLLYLVSNAFEEVRGTPLLGMEKFSQQLDWGKLPVDTVYSRGPAKRARTMSETHGGFDNDPATMNDVLGRVLGEKPTRPFTADDLDY
ncbi:MAG: C1 family peptidase [Synoicihabitans sp.]